MVYFKNNKPQIKIMLKSIGQGNYLNFKVEGSVLYQICHETDRCTFLKMTPLIMKLGYVTQLLLKKKMPLKQSTQIHFPSRPLNHEFNCAKTAGCGCELDIYREKTIFVKIDNEVSWHTG